MSNHPGRTLALTLVRIVRLTDLLGCALRLRLWRFFFLVACTHGYGICMSPARGFTLCRLSPVFAEPARALLSASLQASWFCRQHHKRTLPFGPHPVFNRRLLDGVGQSHLAHAANCTTHLPFLIKRAAPRMLANLLNMHAQNTNHIQLDRAPQTCN